MNCISLVSEGGGWLPAKDCSPRRNKVFGIKYLHEDGKAVEKTAFLNPSKQERDKVI